MMDFGFGAFGFGSFDGDLPSGGYTDAGGHQPTDHGEVDHHRADRLGDDLVPGVAAQDDHLWLANGDRLWDLGPADVDLDGDGVADSITTIGSGEMTTYSDIDRSGWVGRITRVDVGGQVSVHTRVGHAPTPDARGADAATPSADEWIRTRGGRLD